MKPEYWAKVITQQERQTKRELGLDYFFKLIVFFYVHFEALGFRLTFDYQK